MARYVNADEVEYLILENLNDLSPLIKNAKGTDREKLFFKEMGLRDAMAHLCQAPTADVREVTLCKNCKNASPYWIEGMIFCEDMECPNLENGFCNHAERI